MALVLDSRAKLLPEFTVQIFCPNQLWKHTEIFLHIRNFPCGLFRRFLNQEETDMREKKAAALIAATLMMTNLTACGSKVNEILELVDEGEYSDAADMYQEKNLKDSQTETLCSELKTRIEKAVSDYAANDLDYEDASGIVYGIALLNISELTSSINDAIDQLEELSDSKESYSIAQEYYSDEQYLEAYASYSYVIEADGYYTDAVSKMNICLDKYKSLIQSNVDDYIASGDYDGALSYLSGRSHSGFDEINAIVEELTEDVQVQSIIAEADEYTEDGDIQSAISAVTEGEEKYGIKNNATLTAYKENITDEYVSMILEKADALCEKENYIAALNMLNTAYDITQSDEIASLIEHIEEIKPTYLYDLKISESSNYEVIDTGDQLMDTIGNTYDVGNLFEISADGGSWSNDEGYAKYCLGYNYATLTGVVSVDDISDTASATLQIEGDDVVLYTLELSRTTTPTNISIDVSSVNWLKISLVNPADGKTYAILSNFQLSDEKTAATEAATTAAATEAAAETAAEATDAE
jgi:tetratricopeptide (TPR) repeat protein